jgi:hypothetical protein
LRNSLVNARANAFEANARARANAKQRKLQISNDQVQNLSIFIKVELQTRQLSSQISNQESTLFFDISIIKP